MENYNNISSDTGQDKNERQPVGRITCTTMDNSGQVKTERHAV